jgi:hypothetical protein
VYTACVDNYTDYNPQLTANAPALRASSSDPNALVKAKALNAYQNSYVAYVLNGDPVTITVTVVDAPGKIGDISVTSSVPDFATVELDEASASALAGKTSGDFTFTLTPVASSGSLNVVVNVSDTQKNKDGESAPLTTTLTIPVSIVGPCLSEGITPGNYMVTEASGNIDGGAAYDLPTMVSDGGSNVVVVVSKDRPGLYTIDEVTGGVWPLYYSGRARPKLKIDLCDGTITGHTGNVTAGSADGTGPQRKFTIDGTINEDGTITITWSYQRLDAGTPANPASGTFTMQRITAPE